MTQRHDSNNYIIHSNPPELNSPELNPELDIFASTSLKNSKDKDTLVSRLRGIGCMCDPTRQLTRQVARSLGVNPPFVQETNDFFIENIATTTERDTNYVHQGWSIDATSTISPWALSRTITQNGPNNSGAWITRRTVIKRLSVQVSLTDLVSTSEFQDEIEVALSQPTVFQQFRGVYRTFHGWSVKSTQFWVHAVDDEIHLPGVMWYHWYGVSNLGTR
ncbi:hypothetical protein AG1IA_00855 [Rhizoctonia solani AG-1 IA]|uniref:Uncharacterized protein n=1 Tax=Thanatephorus cucumeris (strain AG1-IA) TaxID=983506 RepID=L8X473_THACA|nr:hypothetical protein AG1IA_00855 [Rhizoctonia solani AG-1 IA]